MDRAAHKGLKPPRVFPKRSHKSRKLTSVAMAVEGTHYFLSVDEAYELANRLVDTAEAITEWKETEHEAENPVY